MRPRPAAGVRGRHSDGGAATGGVTAGGSAPPPATGAAGAPRAIAWILPTRALAGTTARPPATCSRMRASSSSASWAMPRAPWSPAALPSPICTIRLSSSWARSPMALTPAMRAPPLKVCSERLSEASCSPPVAGAAFQLCSADCEASSSSLASSQKMAATSGSKSTAAAPGPAAGCATCGCCISWKAGSACRPVRSPCSAASAMRRSSSCSARAMRARSVSCTVKYMVSSSRWPATAAIALMQSASSSRSESSRPTPLSKDLRSQ